MTAVARRVERSGIGRGGVSSCIHHLEVMGRKYASNVGQGLRPSCSWLDVFSVGRVFSRLIPSCPLESRSLAPGLLTDGVYHAGVLRALRWLYVLRHPVLEGGEHTVVENRGGQTEGRPFGLCLAVLDVRLQPRENGGVLVVEEGHTWKKRAS